MAENKLYNSSREEKRQPSLLEESSGFDLDIWNSLTPEEKAEMEAYIKEVNAEEPEKKTRRFSR